MNENNLCKLILYIIFHINMEGQRSTSYIFDIPKQPANYRQEDIVANSPVRTENSCDFRVLNEHRTNCYQQNAC